MANRVEQVQDGSAQQQEPGQQAPEPVEAPTRRKSAPMAIFLTRRILISLLVLFGATFIVFNLLAYAVDPLENLRFSSDPSAPAMMDHLTTVLHLNYAPPVRYFMWLGNVFQGDFGQSIVTQQSALSMLTSALPTTLRLVTVAIVSAMGLGILVGIVAALRQYTRFDYTVTFFSFVLFSLPSFWVAVLLQIWVAIGFNDFLQDPTISPAVIAGISLVGGVILSASIAGPVKTRWISFGVSTLATALLLTFVSTSDWLQRPSLGVLGIAVLGAAAAFAIVALTAGLKNKKALYASLATVAIGVILYFPLQHAFVATPGSLVDSMGWWFFILLALVAVIVGVMVGYFFGGQDRRISMRAAGITALFIAAFTFVDRVMQIWHIYVNAQGGRPLRVQGASTPALAGDFWVHTLDQGVHLLLPTITLTLISFASYTRYSRASMLEVMNQDYIRTARAKGLSERVVTLRHAFRNALIPLATIIPLDIAGLIGGAIITEQIFGWVGMGTLFIQGLNNMDVAVVMIQFLTVGLMTTIATIAIDFIYAALDPRIRVNS